MLSSGSSAPPWGSFYYQHLFFCKTHFILPWMQRGLPSMSVAPVVAAARPAGSTPRGPAIDVTNSGGGRCWTCREHPQGGRHRRLQLWWWPLPDLPAAPPKGPAINVAKSDGGRCRTYQHHPPGGPPSTSPASMVAAAGPIGSIPGGARHRRRHPPRCPAIEVSLNLVPAARIFLVTPTMGATTVNNTVMSKKQTKKSGSLRCQETGSRNTITEKSKSTDSVTTVSIIRITKRGSKATAGQKVYASSGSRSNCSATTRAASSTPSLAASVDPSTGPCTTGSKEMLGSWLRKHIRTWSAARMC
jgi:hypothetical protein